MLILWHSAASRKCWITSGVRKLLQSAHLSRVSQVKDWNSQQKDVFNLRFGVCASIEKAAVVRQAGYDFIECTVVSLRPEENDAAVQDTMNLFLNSPIPVEAFNILLPQQIKIVGEHVDYDRIKKYLSTALHRVQAVGGETIVFGSGGARSLPDQFPREKGEGQLMDFLHLIADVADRLNLVIAVEPLNTKESNIINSVPEGYVYVQKAERPSIRLLADFYHMDEESEPLENIVRCQDLIRHIHVADTGRLAPGTGQYPYLQFADCLQQAQYDGRISIECRWQDFDQEIEDAREYLRSIFGH